MVRPAAFFFARITHDTFYPPSLKLRKDCEMSLPVTSLIFLPAATQAGVVFANFFNS